MGTLLEGYVGYRLSRLRVRFWLHVDEDLSADQCWEWRGATAQGQPTYGHKHKQTSARCFAYALERGDIDEDSFVITTCRNRLCVNPAHLVLAERRPENQVDDEMKDAARRAVLARVSSGAMPRAKDCRCVYCGQQAADYHHHKGYEPQYAIDVIPVCRKCHRRAEWKILKERGPVYFV